MIKPTSDGLLIAVVDGLGHGHEAVAAARSAIEALAKYAEEPLVRLVKCCHETLTRTRGVVLTVVTLQPHKDQLTWLGVGNVEALLLRAKPQPQASVARAQVRPTPAATDRVVLRSGIVGYQLPALHANTVSISPGDELVIVTDGIAASFSNGLAAGVPAQQLAERIMGQHFKGTDDALVAVVNYIGGGHE